MENDHRMNEAERRLAAAALSEAERAAAAPYLDFPPTLWWEPWAVGVWAGLQAWVFASNFGATEFDMPLGVQPLLIIALVFYLAWQQRRHGALPYTMWGEQVPAEIKRAYRNYFIGVLVLLVAVGLLVGLTTPLIAGVGTAALSFVGYRTYDRAYRAAAERARVRLA